MLAAQISLIVLSQPLTEISNAGLWLWSLTFERNIPNTLASAQLVLVGAVALLTAWRDLSRPRWQRLYLIGIAVVFYHLARDEFFQWNELFPDWKVRYAAVGLAMAAATLLVAARSPRRSWVWQFCFLGGLAMSAAGAILLDEPPIAALCQDAKLMRSSGCLLAVVEESIEVRRHLANLDCPPRPIFRRTAEAGPLLAPAAVFAADSLDIPAPHSRRDHIDRIPLLHAAGGDRL